jgi:hypothetical protein
MPSIVVILQNTPRWVFVLFAILVVLGVQALRARTLPIWRLLITPVIFIGWGVASLALQSLSSPILLADWLIAAAFAAAIAWTVSRLDNFRIDHARHSVSLNGSAFPIIRNLVIFSAKYVLGVAIAVAPALRSELALADIAVSGASAGYFLGWTIRFASIYRRSVDPDLTTQMQR